MVNCIFKVNYCGVRHGGILSPILFNVYVDDLISLFEKCGLSCHVAMRPRGSVRRPAGVGDRQALPSPPSCLVARSWRRRNSVAPRPLCGSGGGMSSSAVDSRRAPTMHHPSMESSEL